MRVKSTKNFSAGRRENNGQLRSYAEGKCYNVDEALFKKVNGSQPGTLVKVSEDEKDDEPRKKPGRPAKTEE